MLRTGEGGGAPGPSHHPNYALVGLSKEVLCLSVYKPLIQRGGHDPVRATPHPHTVNKLAVFLAIERRVGFPDFRARPRQ
jgi:hypothetical protein